MNSLHPSYNERIAAELAGSIKDFLSKLPASATAQMPPSSEDFGGRVTLQSNAETAHILWELNSPRQTGPLDGSGALFGDQVCGEPLPSCEDTVRREAIIRISDGRIITWCKGVDPNTSTLWGWALQGLVSAWPDTKATRVQTSPNNYMRTIRALEALYSSQELTLPQVDTESSDFL